MSGTDYKKHIYIVFGDKCVQVGIDKIYSRTSAPMAKQTRFDMLVLERFPQKDIILQINLDCR